MSRNILNVKSGHKSNNRSRITRKSRLPRTLAFIWIEGYSVAFFCTYCNEYLSGNLLGVGRCRAGSGGVGRRHAALAQTTNEAI